jgi:hypothetical protein
MRYSLQAPAVGAVLALLLAPQIATAGLIKWSYAGKILGDGGGPFAHFGIETRHWFDPPTVPGEQGKEGQTDFQIIANIGATFGGEMTGSALGPGRLDLSSVGPAELTAYPLDSEWASHVPGGFRLVVRITDGASGSFRDLSYQAHGFSAGFFLTGTGVANVSVEDRTDAFTLGGNQYTVRPDVSSSGSAEHIELSVEVGQAASTPEPGTLALTGLGLAAGLAVRTHRRR